MCDISGFTPLSAFLANSHNGAETLSLILNKYFGSMIDIILLHGGDVIKFAGDALLCYFPSTAVQRMVSCGVAICGSLSDYPLTLGADETVTHTLSVHCAMTTSVEMAFHHLGGVADYLEFVIADPQGFDDLSVLLEESAAGQVGISHAMLRDVVNQDGYDFSEHYETVKVDGGVKIVDAKMRMQNCPAVATDQLAPPPLPPASITPSISRYIPPNVLHYHVSSQITFLNSNRRVTVLFISLPKSTTASFAIAQEALTEIQKQLVKHSGLLRQFIVDDKSTVAIAVWGAPPYANHNDAQRAIDAAVSIQRVLKQKCGMDTSMGLCTGTCFLGNVGNERRCEYVVLGSPVNTSARLMGLSMKKKGSSIHCDENTKDGARDGELGGVVFSEPQAVQLKGLGEVTAYTVVAGNQRIRAGSVHVELPVLRGREDALSNLLDAYQRNVKSKATVLFVSGPMGFGKSLLVAHFEKALPHATNVIHVKGEEKEKSSPNFLLAAIMKKTGALNALERITDQRLLNMVGILSDLVKYDSELARPETRPRTTQSLDEATPSISSTEERNRARSSVIAPTNETPHLRKSSSQFMDDDFTKTLTGETRMNNLFDLCSALIVSKYEGSSDADEPIVFVVDDVQYVDESSAKFFDFLLKRQTSRCMFTVICLSRLATLPDSLKSHNEETIKLEGLDDAALLEIFRDVAKFPSTALFDEPVKATIRDSSIGSPLFCKATCQYFVSKNLVQLTSSDTVVFASGADSLIQLEGSAAIESSFIMLVDELVPESQMLVKCASLLPGDFSLDTLFEFRDLVMRKEMDDAKFFEARKNFQSPTEVCQILEDSKICEVTPDGNYYRFTHSSMRAVAYKSLTKKQLVFLHAVYLELLESSTKAVSSSVLATVAEEAEEFKKASNYYLQAAAAQTRSFANKDAHQSVIRARETLEKTGRAMPTSEEELTTAMQLYALSGEIPCLLDAPQDGREFLEKGLCEIAGEKFGEEADVGALLGVQKALQAVHEKFGLGGGGGARLSDFDGRRMVVKECCKIYDRLARIMFQCGEPVKAMYCVYRGVNLGEMLGTSDELAKAYATIAFVLKSTRFGKLAGDTASAVSKDSPTVAFCMMLYGGMVIGEGDFETAEETLNKAIRAATAISDTATLGLSMSVLGWCLFVQGKFAESKPLAAEMKSLGAHYGDTRFSNWGFLSVVRDMVETGEEVGDDLRAELEAYRSQYEQKMMQSDKVTLLGLTVSLAGDSVEVIKKALEESDALVTALESAPCSQLVEFAGICSIIESILKLCWANADEKEAWRERIDRLLACFDAYTKTYPIFAARSLYLRGCAAVVMDGDLPRGADLMKSASTASEKFAGMEYEKEVVQRAAQRYGLGTLDFEAAGAGGRANRRGSMLKNEVAGWSEVSASLELIKAGDGAETFAVVLEQVCSELGVLWEGRGDLEAAIEDARAGVVNDASSLIVALAIASSKV
jgi:class 3 adenylate cyclase